MVVVVLGFGFMLLMMNQRLSDLKNDSGIHLLKADMQGMTTQISSTTKEINDRLSQAAQYMMGVQQELGKMQEIGRGMKDLQDFLRSPKLRGNVGERVMRDLLEQMIPKSNLSLQYSFRTGVKVDAIVKTKNGLIPIDAKFPMENFTKASQAKTPEEKQRHLHEFAKDVRKHVSDIAKKYILPGEGTVDFAIMYVPSEAIYYEIICNDELINVGVTQQVYIVSPQTFYYFLKTIMLALEGEKVESRAKSVLMALKGIQQDARRFGDDLGTLDRHLTFAKKAMETTNNNYARLQGKIETTGQLQAESVGELEESQPRIGVEL